MGTHGTNITLSACLVSVPWLCQAVDIISTAASAVAAVTGAIVGVWTLYRMWKNRKTV